MPDSLVTRAHLFGNPNRSGGTISPDGLHLAWVAPLDNPGIARAALLSRGPWIAASPALLAMTGEGTGRPVKVWDGWYELPPAAYSGAASFAAICATWRPR